MYIEIGGKRYDNIKSCSAAKSIESVVIPFSGVCSVSKLSNFPIKRQGKAKLYIDNNLIVSGVIDKIEVSTGNETHDISFSGNSETKDLVDSCIEANYNVNSTLTMEALLRDLFAQNNIPFGVITRTQTKPFTAADIIAAERGNTLWSFIDKYLRKRQVFATVDGRNNIILTRASNNLLKYGLVHRKQGNTRQNNVLSSTYTFDDSNRFHRYVYTTQDSLIAATGIQDTFNAEQLANVQGIAIDPEIRKSRTLVIVGNSEAMMSAQEKAEWERDIRKARAFTGKANVQGFYADRDSEKILWDVNQLVPLIEENVEGAPTVMLTKAVEWNFSEGGCITKIDLATADSFTLEYTKLSAKDRTANFNFHNEIGRENLDKEFII